MRGKYRKRRHARIMREGGTIALAERPLDSSSAPTWEREPRPTVRRPAPDGAIERHAASVAYDKQINAAIAEAQRMRRSKKRGCANLDRNMESLGFRRVSGSEMVPEQFEVAS